MTAVLLRRPPVYKPRDCEGCGRRYQPNGSRQRYCGDCGGPDGDKRAKKQMSAERLRRDRGSSPRPGRPAYKPRTCPGCGQAFSPRSGSQERCDKCASPASRKARARYVDQQRRAREKARELAREARAARITELAAAGMPQRKIAAEVGCSRTTVQMVLSPNARKRHKAGKKAWRAANPEARRRNDRAYRTQNAEAIWARRFLQPYA